VHRLRTLPFEIRPQHIEFMPDGCDVLLGVVLTHIIEELLGDLFKGLSTLLLDHHVFPQLFILEFASLKRGVRNNWVS